MRIRSLLAAMVLALPVLLGSCSSIGIFNNDVRVRVRNTGAIDLQAVEIGFGAPTQAFGDVEAGRATGYRDFDHAYRYGFVEAYAGGERFVMQPVDFVGEEKLRGGDYTFELALDASGRYLTQKIVRD